MINKTEPLTRASFARTSLTHMPLTRTSLIRTFVSVLISFSLLSYTVLASATDIEWSMPDRLLENIDYPGYDASSPVPVYDPNVQMLPVDGWLVNFNACSNTNSTSTATVSYEWFVDDEFVAVVNDCRYAHKFPEEGVYQVSVNLIGDLGVIETVTQEVTVQDWLIVALGDSYGSGEGNPIEPVSVSALKEYSELTGAVSELNNEIQTANDEIATLEASQPQMQLSIDNTLVIRSDAESALNSLNQQQQAIVDLITRAENDPAVITENENVITAQLFVEGWQAEVDNNQRKYNSCSNFISCAIALNTLNQSKQELQNALNDLAAAEGILLAAKDAAVVKYSTDSSITTFNQLAGQQSALNTAVLDAISIHDNAILSHQLAVDTLQNSIEEINSLQIEIVGIQQSSDQVSSDSKKVFLDNLPVWTRTAPSWGTPEPDYGQIVLNGQIPGEALRCHRSMISGQARAALKLEQADPHTSVTFLHLSCSGSSIDNLIGSYEGQDIESLLTSLKVQPSNIDYQGLPNLAPIKAQIEAAAEISAGREVDAIIISVGASDIQFTDIINECVTSETCNEGKPSNPTEELRDALTITVENNCSPTSLLNDLTGLSLEFVTFPFTDNCTSDYKAAETNVDGSVNSGEALQIFNDNTFGTIDEQGAIEKISLADKLKTIQSDNAESLDAQISNTQSSDTQNNDNEINAENIALNSKATLDKHFPALDSQRIYLTQYPDPTSDDVSSYCGWSPDPFVNIGQETDADAVNAHAVNETALINIPGITQAESKWLDITVVSSLREELKNTAALQQWTYVTDTAVNGDTIASVSKQHGYCAEDHWVVRLSESLLAQQDDLGFMHPNREGHEIYQQAIAAQLIRDFYPNGLAMPPRVPDRKQLGLSAPVDVQVASASGDLGSLAPVHLLMISFIALLFRVSSRCRRH